MVNTLNQSWGSQASTANTTQFWTTCGIAPAVTTTETAAQIIMRSAGTLSNMWIRITANGIAATPSITINSRVNAGLGNQQVTPGSTATGTFTDSTHSDVLAAGAKINIETIPGATTGTITMTINSFLFAASSNTVTRMGVLWNINGGNTISTGTPNQFYQTLAGSVNNFAYLNAETTGVKCRQQKAGTFQNASINLATNTCDGTSTMVGRINAGGTASNISVSITTSTAGFFEDTTHTDTVSVGQDYDTLTTGQTSTGVLGPITVAIDFSTTTGIGQLCAASDTQTAVLESVTTNFGLGGTETTTTTELNTEGLTGAAFTFSNLNILITANTVTLASTLTLRANAASPSSGPVASITLSTIGVFTDSIHTYVAATTDLVDSQLVTGTTGTSLKFSNQSIWATLPTSTLYVRAISDSVTTILATITGSG